MRRITGYKTASQVGEENKNRVNDLSLFLNRFYVETDQSQLHPLPRLTGLMRSLHNNVTDYTAASQQIVTPGFTSPAPVTPTFQIDHFTMKDKTEKVHVEQLEADNQTEDEVEDFQQASPK